jgi:hypothetical protein
MGEFPNKATQFPVNRKDHTKKGPYLTPILNKLLSGNMPAKDTKTKALLKSLELPETVGVWLALRWILNGTEGDTRAIEGIFERIDGKLPQTLVDKNQTDVLLEDEIEFVERSGNGHGKEDALERYKGLLA